jgi:hypothetical protein
MQWRTSVSFGTSELTDFFVRIALAKDDTAVIFGEDVAFGGVFRCTMVTSSTLSLYRVLLCLTVGPGGRVW